MKKLTTLTILVCLFVGLSCEVPDVLNKPFGARTGTYVNSDLTGQWKVYWVDLDTYGFYASFNTTCLNSNWLYFNTPDVTNGNIIEGNWTTTNLSCTESHSGQDLLDAWGDNYSIAFEQWNSISGLPQRYTFDKSTGDLTLSRGVSSSMYVTKYLNIFISEDKNIGNSWNTTGRYTNLFLTRSTGGPSVP